MPSRKIPLVSDCYYHIFSRGVNKIPIFIDTKDFQRFYNLLNYCCFIDYPVKFSKYCSLSLEERKKIMNRLKNKFIDLVSYCIMPNHFHFLFLQKTVNGISLFMGRLLNSYTKYFNLRHKRTGPLFEQRFKAVLVEKDEQLLHLVRYIHLNPYSSFIVKDVKKLIDYPWSSFKEYLVNEKGICDKKIVLDFFKNSKDFSEFNLNQAEYQRSLNMIKHLSFD